MSKLKVLEDKVRELYETRLPSRDGWADWLYVNHVVIVLEKAKELSGRFNIDNDLAPSAAVLHDIADAVMSRFDVQHEDKSLEIATKLLSESSFSEQEIQIIVEDILKNHSCRNGNLPRTVEGKLMATADAVAHLATDFYTHVREEHLKVKSLEEIQPWVKEKIDRDFHIKIFWPEIQTEMRPFFELRYKEFGLTQ